MELTYKELAKRDVVNVADGRCLGKIINIKFNFPQGVIVGIFVPARKNKGLFWFLDRSTLYIDVSKIVKIGGDVILVDIKCGETCAQSTPIKKPSKPCPPPCPPNPCQPNRNGENQTLDLSSMFDQNGNIDLEDY